MRRKLQPVMVPTVAAVLVALTILVSLVGVAPADAATRYAAGNETSGTHICNCPVTVGNCVCAYTDPEPVPAPIPVEPHQV